MIAESGESGGLVGGDLPKLAFFQEIGLGFGEIL